MRRNSDSLISFSALYSTEY